MKRLQKVLWVPLAAALGCATAQLVGTAPRPLPKVEQPKRVVLEPFFEDTRWQLKTHSDTQTYLPYNPAYAPITFTRIEQWQEKPLYAKTDVLGYEHRLAIEDLKKAAPKWEVLTTSAVNRFQGPLTLVRVIVGEKDTLASDRSSHNVAFLFSWLAVPLLYELTPVHETERVHGTIIVYRGTAEDLRSRLIKYDTQPDYAVNTRGLPRAQETFAIDLSYTEGILAAEPPRNRALVAGFTEKLAHEIARFIASGPTYVSPPAQPQPTATLPFADGGTVAGELGGLGGDAGVAAADGGSSGDGGTSDDAGISADAGTLPDAGVSGDAGTASDAGSATPSATDAGFDGGVPDAGSVDAGVTTAPDAGTKKKVRTRHPSDAGIAPDAGSPMR